jgi:D-alanyl-D-alanine carboxypeptidase/D-alanyl-D-alanine-endopeptidase (penicillin-binding protein 4)
VIVAAVGKVLGTSVAVVVLLGGAYLTADAYDVVPGGLTLAPVPAPASPFPTPPAASAATASATPALSDLDPQAPLPLAGVVQAAVDQLVADPRLGPTTGVVVADRLTGEVLASHLPDEPRIPASTAKLFTAAAVLGTLDPATTLPTTVVAGEAADEIVLVGGGDMMLAAGAGDPTAVIGRAGLADLAAQVAKELALRGTTSVHLRLDDTLFTGPTTSPGWSASDLNLGFVAPIAPIAVDLGRTNSDATYAPSQTDPAMSAAQEFAARLGEAGIAVDGRPTRATAPTGARVLGEVRSAPLADVVAYDLAVSDNTVADLLSRLVALDQGLPATFDGASKAVLHAVETLGVDVSGVTLGDASGLADGSAIPPRRLVALLALATDGRHPQLRALTPELPIAGLSGTLADRYTDSPARGEVRAKTGSLTGVTSLAGTVVTADGRQLLFAVMADATPAGGQAAPRAAIDAFVAGLAGCGCR